MEGSSGKIAYTVVYLTPFQEQDKQQDNLARSVPHRHCESSISANLPTMVWGKEEKGKRGKERQPVLGLRMLG